MRKGFIRASIIAVLLLIAEVMAIAIGAHNTFFKETYDFKGRFDSIREFASMIPKTSDISEWKKWFTSKDVREYAYGDDLEKLIGKSKEIETVMISENADEIADEKELIEIPDLVGMNTQIAKSIATGLGFKYVVDSRAYNDYYEEDIVSRQYNTPGEKVEKGTKILVVLSAGVDPADSNTVVFPNLIGITPEKADEILTQMGWNYLTVYSEWSDDMPEGLIIAQSIEPGTKATPGESAEVIVSKGPEQNQDTDNNYVYDADTLCQLASDYYYNLHGIRPPCVRVDSFDGDIINIHLYEALSDHVATWDWYSVNRVTGETQNIMGDSFNLFENMAGY